MTEQETNAAAKAASSATTPDSSQIEAGAQTDASAQASAVSDPSAGQSAAAKPSEKGKSEPDWKGQYEALTKQTTELLKKLNVQGKEKNDYRKRFETLDSTMKQLSESVGQLLHKDTYDPDQFMEEFRAQGPQFILNLVKKEREKILADTNSRVDGLTATVTELRTERAINARKADAENYPDFAKLEGDMVNLYNANRALFDSQYEDLDEKIDALYNAAKLQRSPNALKEAEALGRKKTEEELAREAHAAGAGGGKAGAVSAPDPDRMTLAELREHFRAQGKVRDY